MFCNDQNKTNIRSIKTITIINDLLNLLIQNHSVGCTPFLHHLNVYGFQLRQPRIQLSIMKFQKEHFKIKILL